MVKSKKKYLLIIPITIGAICVSIFTFFVVFLITDLINIKHPVPKWYWHITEENWDEYKIKYCDYIETIAIEPFDCIIEDEIIDKKTNNVHWTYAIHYNDGYVLRIYLSDLLSHNGLACLELELVKNNLLYDDLFNIDEKYLDVVYKIFDYCVYKSELEEDTLKNEISIKAESENSIFFYREDMIQDSYLNNYILMQAIKDEQSELYKFQIEGLGYLTDKNVWNN